MLSKEILRKHIKIQREECAKYEVDSQEFKHHWELLGFLCEIGNLRDDNEKMFKLLIEKEVIKLKE